MAPTGPADRQAISFKKHVLLLDTEPGLFVFRRFHCHFARVACVCVVRLIVRVENFAENQLVPALEKGIPEQSYWGEVQFRVNVRIRPLVSALATKRAPRALFG